LPLDPCKREIYEQLKIINYAKRSAKSRLLVPVVHHRSLSVKVVELHWASGARKISMTNSAKKTMSAVVSLATACSLLNLERAGRDLVTVTGLISISLLVTKDST
jgi:hypothetical protein